MNPIVHQFSKCGVDCALARNPVQASEDLGLNGECEVAFAAAVMAGVADMMIALVFENEVRRSKRGDEALFYLGGDRAVGGGDGIHLFYIGR